MNVVLFDRILPEPGNLPFLTNTFKATSKSQNFVQIQVNLHLLLKFHAAIQHRKYIVHLRHCQAERKTGKKQGKGGLVNCRPLDP